MAFARIVRVGALSAFMALVPASAALALGRPVPTAPLANTSLSFLPAFSWKPVAGAAKYQFQIAGDASFSSIVFGAGTPFTTRNTAATVKDGLPPATYWWRVRALDETGAKIGAWSAGLRVVLRQTATPSLLSPTDGAAQAYPEPVVLKWQTVAAAEKYRVWVATDPELANVVTTDPIETAATEWTVNTLLPASQRTGAQTTTYYWAVAPIDPLGYQGSRSTVRSFIRTWNSTTTPTAADASPEASLYTPRLSWTSVPGAAAYEVEINAAPTGWASSGKVCCTAPTSATTLVPTTLLENNNYRWRVRPLDGADNAGDWSYPAVASFTKDFNADQVQNLHMADNLSDAAADLDAGTVGIQTSYPIVKWDPVVGAAAYRFTIAPFDGNASRCDWQSGGYFTTASTAATLLASRNLGANPPLNPNNISIANSDDSLVDGTRYCAKVEAIQGYVNYTTPVLGPAKTLNNGHGWSFQYQTPAIPADTSCSLELCADEYLGPIGGVGIPGMPLLKWKPVQNARSYWVYVYRDAALTNPIDVALTQEPAYAPRAGGPWTIIHDQIKTYAEEDTGYYWIVIPAANADGTGAFAPDDLAPAFPQVFQKQTPAPLVDVPADPPTVSGTPTLSWQLSANGHTYADGSETYHVQLSQNPSFAPADTTEVTTSSPEYTVMGNLANGQWYWRVQGFDDKGLGLGWSNRSTFVVQLPLVTLDADNPTGGDAIPTWHWTPVPGAIGYELFGTDRRNTHPDWIAATAATTPIGFTGPGTVRWKIRPIFRGATSYDRIYGAYTPEKSYNKLMSAPASLRVTRPNGGFVISWAPKPQAYHYYVDVATDPAFLNVIDSVETESSAFAPSLDALPYRQGGKLWVRVSQYDRDLNRGAYSAATPSSLPYALQLEMKGVANVGKWSKVTFTVKDPRGKAVSGVILRITGSGNRIKAGRTNRHGVVNVSVYVKKGGKFSVSGTRRGYVTGVYEGFAV